MKKLHLVVAAVLRTGMVLAAEKTKSWTGTVSDAVCGKKHGMAGMSNKDCTLACGRSDNVGSGFAARPRKQIATSRRIPHAPVCEGWHHAGL